MNTKILFYIVGAGLSAFFFYRRVYIPLTRAEFICSRCGHKLFTVKSFHVSPRMEDAPSELAPCKFFGLWRVRRYVHESRIFARCHWIFCGNEWEVTEGKSVEVKLTTLRYRVMRLCKWWQIERPHFLIKLR